MKKTKKRVPRKPTLAEKMLADIRGSLMSLADRQGATENMLAVLSGEMSSFVNHLVTSQGPVRAAEQERDEHRELEFFRSLHQLNPHDGEGWKKLVLLPLRATQGDVKPPDGSQFKPLVDLPPHFRIGRVEPQILAEAVEQFADGVNPSRKKSPARKKSYRP
jgi:hypothetical protein